MSKISKAGRAVGIYGCFTETGEPSEDRATAAEVETCPFCMEPLQKKQRLICTHAFCAACLERSVETLGLQCPEAHPNPGKPFTGIQTTACLPNSPEGLEVLKLLQRAFEQKLVFTVAATDGAADRVIFTDIPHAENRSACYLPGFLQKVKAALRAKGIE
ncbi:hypothetical protein SKAU_G00075170 [Synaphobranchus kaupii]|uniref:E3 ubiquitin-protein ligase n=1 Tax=Synaphobranchus kaupii TaxID=118154 RepID=A0A9Q1JC46_SYNKA|nr:hypothetical protein SKAU_G00075170 [Synaphobranchus kaupii]